MAYKIDQMVQISLKSFVINEKKNNYKVPEFL